MDVEGWQKNYDGHPRNRLTFGNKQLDCKRMTIEPLSKEIYNKAKKLGVEKIVLNFSGGSDEGYLNVTLYPWDQNQSDEYNDLSAEIENWAWDVYSYSGAGEGNDYGDDIEYDLVNNRVSTQEWYTARTEGDSAEVDLVIDEED